MGELRHIGDMDEALTSQQRTAERHIDIQTTEQVLRNWLWHSAHRRRAEMRAVTQEQRPVTAVTQFVCFFQDRLEHRREIAR